MDTYHLEGFIPSSLYFGCIWEKRIIAVGAFNSVEEEGEWEMVRFAIDNKVVCPYALSKILNKFKKICKPLMIKLLVDRKWFSPQEDVIYTDLGFINKKTIPPHYYYYNEKKLIVNKEDILQGNVLRYYKIWDCGLFEYVWEKDNDNQRL